MNPCGSAAEKGLKMVMVICGACQLAAPPLSCSGGGVGLPPPLFVACRGSVVSPHVLIWTGVGSWAPALDATGVLAPPPVPAAAIGKEVRAGPSFRGRRGRPFLFLLPIDLALECCCRSLKASSTSTFNSNLF